jgi:transposase
MPKVSRLEVIETGARRQWSLDEKQRIVAESLSAPRNVSATARRHGLSSGQLFTWCRLARQGKLVLDGDAAGFVPAFVSPEEQPADNRWRGKPACGAERGRCGRMEIVLSDRRRIIVGGDVDAAALARVVGVLERR